MTYVTFKCQGGPDLGGRHPAGGSRKDERPSFCSNMRSRFRRRSFATLDYPELREAG